MFIKQTLKKLFKPITVTTFNLFFSLWITLGLNYGFLENLKKLTPYHGFQSVLFVIASGLVITAFYNLIFQIIHWKFNSKYFSAVWIMLGGMTAYFVNSLGVTITPEQIQNMVQTDSREAYDLITPHSIMWLMTFVVLPLIALPSNFG